MAAAGQTSQRFEDLYHALRVADTKRSVLHVTQPSGIAPEDIGYLLTTASRLALDNSLDSVEAATNCQIAYDIAVRAFTFMPDHVKDAAAIGELILSRLGNFPARRLLANEVSEGLDTYGRDPYIASECLVREIENTRRNITPEILLTDFQVRLLDDLETSHDVSISAPTSAGKSFALEQHLVRLLRNPEALTAIYIVPTRALIRQVSFDLIDLVHRNALSASVLSTPIPPTVRQNGGARHLIFVLTQERFATLLGEAIPPFTIDAIIVDEAQEVGKEKRGQTLERVLQIALSRFANSKIFFSSPLRSNPEYLLELFNLQGPNSSHFIEFQSPVSQNIILVHPVQSLPKRAKLCLRVDGIITDLGTLELPFPFRNKYMGKFAHYFTQAGDTSIVYCNLPSSADKIAEQVAAEIGQSLGDEELDDFATFLENEIHHLYKLPELIRKGVAFHYANIPQIVRGKIEELVKARKIRFVCCTSTLLQGMNLPAKNIFVENPKTGRGEEGAINRGDFWNLIGRAGRLSIDFSGNVFCVFGKKWDLDSLINDRYVPIESAHQIAIRQRTRELAFYTRTPPENGESGALWAVQAIASIYADRVALGKRLSELGFSEDLAEFALEVDSAVTEMREAQRLPDDLYARNLYVHPKTLEELGAFFRNSDDLLSLVPLLPAVDRGSARLRAIMETIELFLLKTGTQSYIYYSYLASLWMQGESLREILKQRLDYRKLQENSENVNKEIRDLFREIEEQIRYIYVKYTGIYNQVLAAVLIERGRRDVAEKLVPLHLFLEFGASNRTVINLISLGLSRTSALLLRSSAALTGDLEVSQCHEFIERVNLERTSLPSICKSEIARVRMKVS